VNPLNLPLLQIVNSEIRYVILLWGNFQAFLAREFI